MEKEPISITAEAKGKITEILRDVRKESTSDGPIFIRAFVQGGGCAGFEYGFLIEYSKSEDDFLIEDGEVAVLIDSVSFQYLMGATIDYHDDLDGAKFIIKNPNAASTCGCGSSFTV